MEGRFGSRNVGLADSVSCSEPTEPGRLPELARLGAAVEARAPQIVERYLAGLVAFGSPILDDDAARGQLVDQANTVIALIVDETRPPAPRDSATTRPALSRVIGESRARNRVHPGESWRAAMVLSETLMTTVAEQMTDRPDGVATTTSFSAIVSRVIFSRMLEAWDSYTSVLLHEIHTAQTNERLRIARELHDHVGHGLSAAQRNLELSEIYRAQGDGRGDEAVSVALQMVVAAMTSMHTIIDGMRVNDSALSMELALKQFVETMRPLQPEIVIAVNGDDQWVPHQLSNESFVIVREALRNAIDHASATTITATVNIAPTGLIATVVDDGAGFELRDLLRHNGLDSMHERAGLIGGTLRVTSRHGAGTRVELIVGRPKDCDYAAGTA